MVARPAFRNPSRAPRATSSRPRAKRALHGGTRADARTSGGGTRADARTSGGGTREDAQLAVEGAVDGCAQVPVAEVSGAIPEVTPPERGGVSAETRWAVVREEDDVLGPDVVHQRQQSGRRLGQGRDAEVLPEGRG